MSARTLSIALLLCGLSVAGWLAFTIEIWPSYLEMNAATGAVATLADATLRGQAPAHEDGQSFMATFYFPPFPLGVALAKHVGLSWKDALRVAAIASALVLAAAASALALALGGGVPGVVLANAFLFALYFFKSSSTGGRADLLAAACAIAGLAAWLRDRDARGWWLPAFAAGAFLTKATSVTLPLALAADALVRREPRTIVRFVPKLAACVALGVLATFPWHGPGWYLDAAHELVTATPCTWSVLRSPTEMLRYPASYAELTVTLSFAIAFFATGGAWRGPALPFAGAALALAAFVMMNFGAGHNHLDELAAFAAVCAGVWSARAMQSGSWLPAWTLALAVLGSGYRDLQPLLRHAHRTWSERVEITEAIRAEPGPVFTEDGLLSLAAGRRPAATDPGAVRSLSLKHDPRADRLVAKLDRGEFGLVVLAEDLDGAARWYRDFHLGEHVVDALHHRYRKVGQIDVWHLYEPIGH